MRDQRPIRESVPFSIDPFRRVPLYCPVIYHAGLRQLPTTCLIIMLTLVALGCKSGGVRTISSSSGSHVPYSDAQWAKIEDKQIEKLRVIVWGNHAGATQAAVEILRNGGATIVEPTRVQELFDEEHVPLTHTSDDEFHVFKVGRLAGAEQVVYVNASDKPELVSGPSGGTDGGANRSNTLHQVSVSVRSIDMETGALRWRGHSTMTQPITDPEVVIPILTKAALKRATCAIERGRVWVEYGAESSGLWGCRKKETN